MRKYIIAHQDLLEGTSEVFDAPQSIEASLFRQGVRCYSFDDRRLTVVDGKIDWVKNRLESVLALVHESKTEAHRAVTQSLTVEAPTIPRSEDCPCPGFWGRMEHSGMLRALGIDQTVKSELFGGKS